MQQFEFIIPNEKRKLYNWFAILLFLLSAAGVILKYYYLGRGKSTDNNLGLYTFGICFMAFVFTLIFDFKVTPFTKALTGATMALSLYWFIIGPWWVGGLTFLFMLFNMVAQRDLKVKVQKEVIVYPSFPQRTIKWAELNNLILRDGLLTIDFKNDRIIQQYPDLKMNPVNEAEFNEFCRQQLNK